MVRSWHTVEGIDGKTYLNGSDVVIRKNKYVSSVVVETLFSRLEEMDVPPVYANGLTEIYVTHLKRHLHGDYCYESSKIRIACNNDRFLFRIYKNSQFINTWTIEGEAETIPLHLYS